MSDHTIYRLMKLLVRGIGRLPIGVANFCADLLGLLWFRIDKRHRTVTIENIGLSFPELSARQVERLAIRVFKNIVSILFEIAWSMRFDRETFLSLFTIQDADYIKEAHAQGRGAIGLLSHMGNFDMLIGGLEETGLGGYAVYRQLDFAPLERLILESRQRFNVTMVPTRGASKKLAALLQRGEVIGSLLDQNVDWYNGVFVNFFGRPACTSKGLAKLALKTKAPVVCMYTVRDRKTRRYQIRFLPEIPRQETGCPIKDLENNTQAYNDAIEAVVRKHPDQYFWVHNRWKTKNYCPWPRPE